MKGTTKQDQVEKFLSSLRNSRSRALTLASLQ